MRISTVFFDFGGTLARGRIPLDGPESVWATVGSRYGPPVTTEQARCALDLAERRVGERIYEFAGRTQEFWQLFDGLVMDELHITARRREIELAVQSVFEDPGGIEVFPETIGVLEELRASGLRTGVISNHHDGLVRLLEYHRLSERMDTVTYSQEAGSAKPSPGTFLRALERAACRPEEAVHVGDSIETDVVGARGAGLRAVWINHRGLPPVADLPTVRDLAQLPGLLDDLTRGPD